jgi:hypothetical protein
MSKMSNGNLRDSFIRQSTKQKLSSKGLAFDVTKSLGSVNIKAVNGSLDSVNVRSSMPASDTNEPVKPPDYNFKDNDVMFENSVKKIDLWVESLLI